MPLLNFWRQEIDKDTFSAIKMLEHQINVLDKEWLKYENKTFIDWNHKFNGLPIKDIKPYMKIPLKDVKIEKKEFSILWHNTVQLFSQTIKLLNKGKKERALVLLFGEIKSLNKIISSLEKVEKDTLAILKKHIQRFEPLFDNNYGEGYFKQEVLENYEVRLRILEILKNEYELVRYFISDLL